MITPSIYALQKKFEQENISCKIVQNLGLLATIKFDNSKNKVFEDNVEILVGDNVTDYTIMAPIKLSDNLDLNELAVNKLRNLNKTLSTSLPNYTPCDIEIADRNSQRTIIISKIVEKMSDNEQDINNLYAECLSFCSLPISFFATLKKQMNANKTEIDEKIGGCYIATNVYGSYDCPQVWALRRYRDYKLAATWHGRLFVNTYYAISPTLVKLFGKTTWFNQFWKDILDKMVENLNSQGINSTPYKDIEW